MWHGAMIMHEEVTHRIGIMLFDKVLESNQRLRFIPFNFYFFSPYLSFLHDRSETSSSSVSSLISLITPISLQAYCFSHHSYLFARLSHLSHISPIASSLRLPSLPSHRTPTTTTAVALPPPPRSPSHHRHIGEESRILVAAVGKVHGGLRTAARRRQTHDCWKRGKGCKAVEEAAAAVLVF
ncbi:uncharacterized protein LOC130510098 [Raphanus sativus]|uniref:Uncharacterized protein LOC130510098 n=1 Tax=Raphanus sativus TaxID=3726 RepID=A0A9W3DEZ7_RAPSA|nr:uncharacterized protein LOC130510098 [Raphanus sativus]